MISHRLTQLRTELSHFAEAARRHWFAILFLAFLAWGSSFMLLAVIDNLLQSLGLPQNLFSASLLETPLLYHFVLLFFIWLSIVSFSSEPLSRSLPLSIRRPLRFALLSKSNLRVFIISLGCGFLIWFINSQVSHGFSPARWSHFQECRTCLRADALEAVIIAPLIEEIIFRGILFRAFERSAGLAGAIALTALGFLGVHVQPQWVHLSDLLVIFAIGLVAGVLRAWTGSLWPGWVMHVFNNSLVAISYLRA